MVKQYKEGGIFGELALLYNQPRQASIVATSDCELFSLDRETFNQIVRKASHDKRQLYEGFLKKMEIFASLSQTERMKICDCLKEQTEKKGTLVVKEGDVGDRFYVLRSGTADAVKVNPKTGKGHFLIFESLSIKVQLQTPNIYLRLKVNLNIGF